MLALKSYLCTSKPAHISVWCCDAEHECLQENNAGQKSPTVYLFDILIILEWHEKVIFGSNKRILQMSVCMHGSLSTAISIWLA